jgi:hypothetical protein
MKLPPTARGAGDGCPPKMNGWQRPRSEAGRRDDTPGETRGPCAGAPLGGCSAAPARSERPDPTPLGPTQTETRRWACMTSPATSRNGSALRRALETMQWRKAVRGRARLRLNYESGLGSKWHLMPAIRESACGARTPHRPSSEAGVLPRCPRSAWICRLATPELSFDVP